MLLEAIWVFAARFAIEVDVEVAVADGAFPDLKSTDVLSLVSSKYFRA